MESQQDCAGRRGTAERRLPRAQRRACAQPCGDGAAHDNERALRVPRADARAWGRTWVALVPARRTTGAWLSVGLPCYHVAGAKQSTCTINQRDAYVVVVPSAYLTPHLGGAVCMLVFTLVHGARTSVVWRAQVASDDARPCAMKIKVLTTAVSPSSTCIPCGPVAGGEGEIGDLGLGRLGAGGVGGK